MSRDGRYLWLSTRAPSITGRPDGVMRHYRADLATTPATFVESVAIETSGLRDVSHLLYAADGDTVVFRARPRTPPASGPDAFQVYAYDLRDNRVTAVSRDRMGTLAYADCTPTSVSSDGMIVGFVSRADNFVLDSGLNGEAIDAFVVDRRARLLVDGFA